MTRRSHPHLFRVILGISGIAILAHCNDSRGQVREESHQMANPGGVPAIKIQTLSVVGNAGLFLHDFPESQSVYYEDDHVLHALIEGVLDADEGDAVRSGRGVWIYARVEDSGEKEETLTDRYSVYRGVGFFISGVPNLTREIHGDARVLVDVLSQSRITLSGLIKQRAEYYDSSFGVPHVSTFRDVSADRIETKDEFVSACDELWPFIQVLFEDPADLTYEGNKKWVRNVDGLTTIVQESPYNDERLNREFDEILKTQEQ